MQKNERSGQKLGEPLSSGFSGGVAALLVMVMDDLCRILPAGRIEGELEPIAGGAGSGKAQLSEAGVKDSSKLADAIDMTYSVVESILIS